jgi:hypothetical protein
MTTTSTKAARRGLTLAGPGREFWKHPSPWMIGATLLVALAARVAAADWQLTDALVPVAMLAVFPFFEWVVHVSILHWRPRRLGPVTIDPLLARKHREHHVDPRDVPLVFIPAKALMWILPAAILIAALGFPRLFSLGVGLTFLVFLALLGLGYEWTHYLIHSDYKPKSAVYRAIGEITASTTTRTSTTGSRSPAREPRTGCCEPIPTPRVCPAHRRRRTCTGDELISCRGAAFL